MRGSLSSLPIHPVAFCAAMKDSLPLPNRRIANVRLVLISLHLVEGCTESLAISW
jgi:hypothetical protein